jgi:hypothetical protein
MPDPPEPQLPTSGRGRPLGSVRLTAQIQAQIVGFIRAGAYAHVAAQAAGVPERTFHEWCERGEGRHPSRPPTSELEAFAREVRIAQAEARATAEIRVFREHPRYWLSHVARSRPESEGWTQVQAEREGSRRGSELAEIIQKLDKELAPQKAAWEQGDACSDADCGCADHLRRSNGERYPPELYGD